MERISKAQAEKKEKDRLEGSFISAKIKEWIFLFHCRVFHQRFLQKFS